MAQLVPIGSGFWNARASHYLVDGILKLVDIGTHMSILRLKSGSFLLVDCIPLTKSLKKEIDELTENGTLIEAIIGVHPFHTSHFPEFHHAYPAIPMFGTPRHARKYPSLPWAGILKDCQNLNAWYHEGVELRIPDGAEYEDPQPEFLNHFASVFVFHRESSTLHVDDTLNYFEQDPSLAIRILRKKKKGDMAFHPSIKGPGLHPSAAAPIMFRAWMYTVIADWEFDNMCTAHGGRLLGGAHEKVWSFVKSYETGFEELAKSEERQSWVQKKQKKRRDSLSMTCECG